MSPQQLDGQIPSISDDVYSLGATLYDLLVGMPPFYSGDLLHQVRNVEACPLIEAIKERGGNSDLPEAVVTTIQACLSKNPDKRPATIGDVIKAIGLRPLARSPFDSGATDSSTASPGKLSLFSTLRNSAEIARLQLLLKKLEFFDLRDAHAEAGEMVFQAGLASERFADQFERLSKIDAANDALRAKSHDETDKSLSAKARRAAASAADRVEERANLLGRKQILIEIGGQALEEIDDTADLEEPRQRASAIQGRIDDARRDLIRLESSGHPLARHPLAGALVIGVLALLGWRLAAHFLGPSNSDYDRASYSQTENFEDNFDDDVDTEHGAFPDSADLPASNREYDRQVRLNQIRIQQAAEDGQERHERDMEEAERLARAERQPGLKTYAAEQFETISIDLKSELSGSLKRNGTEITLRGERLTEIRAYYENEDWLELVNLLRRRDSTEFPGKSEIADAAHSLRENWLWVYAKTPHSNTGRAKLFLITIDPKNTSFFDYSYSWERHPDNNGFIHRRKSNNEPVAVVSGETAVVVRAMKALQQSHRLERSNLKRKRDLGELDAAAFDDAMTKMQASLRQQLQT
jgi:hypothetical protein